MIEKIDFYFPFLMFAYGVLLMAILQCKARRELAAQKMPSYLQRFEQHRGIALLAFIVGGLWSAQNLLLPL